MEKRGFSLIEIIIAMTIMAIVISVAIPSFVEFRKKREVKAASKIMIEIFKRASSSAKLKKTDHYVVFDKEGHALKIVEESESLIDAVRYETIDDWVYLPGQIKYSIQGNIIRKIPLPDDKSPAVLVKVIKFDKTTGLVSGALVTVFFKDKPVITLSEGVIKYV